MFCENCGAPLKDGAKFCPNCGAKVAYNTPAAEPAPTYVQPAYTEPQVTASDQPAKLYYPDPNRFGSNWSFKEHMAMNAADDTDDFPK